MIWINQAADKEGRLTVSTSQLRLASRGTLIKIKLVVPIAISGRAQAREKRGVEIKQLYLTSGESDLVAIVDIPNGRPLVEN